MLVQIKFKKDMFIYFYRWSSSGYKMLSADKGLLKIVADGIIIVNCQFEEIKWFLCGKETNKKQKLVC